MSKPKPKSKPRFDLTPFINGFFLLLGLGNLAVIVVYELTRKPRVDRVYTQVTTNHVIVVTNFINSSSMSKFYNSTNQINASTVEPVKRVPYKLYFWDGRPFMTLGGFEFGVGSPTSFGRILEIYPDKFLTDRCWVENSNFGLSRSFVSSKPSKEDSLND